MTKHAAWLASACLAAYYALSASRDLSLYDSGELALAAVQLGLGHPPGQPLHTLLGHLFAVITAQVPLIGVNLLSALAAALTILPATRIALQLTAAELRGRAAAWIPWMLLLFGLHESLWEPATRVEVYTLANLLALSAIACALPLFAEQPEGRVVVRRCALAGVLLGLSASSNPMIAAAAGLALTPGVTRAALRAGVALKVLPATVLGGALGLVPYLYLPLVAARDDVLIWGGLSDAASYLRYLTLRDYARNQTLGAVGTLTHAGAWISWSLEHLLSPVLILGLGAFHAARAQLRFALSAYVIAFTAMLSLISFNVGWSLEVPDYNGYLGIAYWLGAAGASALLWRCAARKQLWAAASVALCMGAGLWSPPAPWTRTRATDRLARTLAEQVLTEAPPGAILITFADYFAGTLFYLQEVEHKRTDVAVLAYGLSGSSWHWQRLHALHPDLKPANLTQRGDRLLRVRAWLRDNAERAVLVERYPLARALELPACAGGLYFWTGAMCTVPSTLAPAMSQLLADQLTQLGDGSPAALGAIAEVSEQLGAGLWQLGLPRAAHDAFLSGVPRSAWPTKLADPKRLAAARALVAPTPSWTRAAALGDPARNLFLAGAVTAASGQAGAAQWYLHAAAGLRLPEAEELLQKER